MKLHSDKIVILTGGAGFIGSCVLRELNNRGVSQIVVVDDLGETEAWKNLVGKRFTDLLHKDQLFDWLHGRESEIGSIIHLGACSSTVEKNANFLLENNYQYTKQLAEFALKANIRFVYASSAATYGDGSSGFSDNHSHLENLKPLNMYGYSKHLFDLWALREGVLSQLCGLKYFNVYGPNEYHKGRMSSAILKMVPEAQKTGTISLFVSSEPEKFENGGQKRDFIYVKDVARITCDLLESSNCGIFNVGTGKAGTWNELASSVFNALQLPEDIVYIALPEDLQGKYQNFTQADIGKLRKALLKEPCAYSLQDAVKEYVREYLLKCTTW